LLTVTDGKVKVGVGVIDGEGVMLGVKVMVGDDVIVAVGVGVKVGVGVGVAVQAAALAVRAVDVMVACLSDEGAQADRTSRTMKGIFDL